MNKQSLTKYIPDEDLAGHFVSKNLQDICWRTSVGVSPLDFLF